jgi:hypothetical protein
VGLVLEKADSRPISAGGANNTATLRYIIQGYDNEADALDALATAAPTTLDGLLRRSWRVEPLGDGSEWWEGSVEYGGTSTQKAVGCSSYSFEIGGGTQHITQALAHIASYAPPGKTPPAFGGAIGVTQTEVEGCDIDVPVYNFSETHYKASTFVTGTYKATLFAIACNPVNSGAFRGFAAGEVRFLGASGSQRGDESWELTFRFAALPNVTGLQIGSITGIAKKGWEYMWVRYEDAEDSGSKTLIKKAASVHIEQVYGTSNFAGLGIGTS